MTAFTDIFIRRPVLASVLSLLILLLGAQAIYSVPVRQFPKLTNTQITITTSYPGASAELMQGFVSTPIEQAVSSADGIDYMVSSSTPNLSTVSLFLRLNADPDRALTEVLSKVNQVRNVIPREANDPVVVKQTGESTALMYIGFNSADMTSPQITDYLTRVIQPRLQTVPGVSEARVLGGQTFAMRIWLNPERMAALAVTPQDVSNALRANNFVAAPGQIKGDYTQINIDAQTSATSARAFANLVIAARNGTLIRLGNVADIELGPQSADSSSIFTGLRAVFVGIYAAPTANPLTVISDVRRAVPDIESQLPAGLKATIAYDATVFINASIDEVVRTLLEAAGIVIVVIFLFLGSLRSTLIPVVTIPLSLIGVMFALLILGYSINLLTLLAMVLAIGLVVDDAIVVVENVHRHIENGSSRTDAALQGAREIAWPVIAMTITLAAVYAPIGFVGGLTGGLFREFAFTLAASVIVSGVVALTLSPMMCSRLLPAQVGQGRLAMALDRLFDGLKNRYARRLHGVLTYRPVVVLIGAVVLGATGFLYVVTQKELAPIEDQGVIFMITKAPESANLDYLERYTAQLDPIYRSIPEAAHYFNINGSGTVHNGFAGFILKPWGERGKSQEQVMAELQPKLNGIAGVQAFAFPRPSLPGTTGQPPLQFVIKTTSDSRTLAAVVDQLQAAAAQSGLFIFTDSDLRFDSPQIDVRVDNAKANQLGISMADVGGALATVFGGNYVNRFDLNGRSYQVIPQASRDFRLNPERIGRIHVRAANGAMVPLSTVTSISQSVQPNALTNFQQLNSATIQGVMFPGRTLGEGLAFFEQQAAKIFPAGFSYDFKGESRQYVQEGNTLAYAFGFAIIVIFLVLAAQFESYRDPLIILLAVPMSICGALIPLSFGLATINIYTQIGLVTLIGLISKHGILMVDFANHLQINEGLDRRAAIEKAAAIRLRPILMTTASMVVAMVPLLIASGAGARSRFDIGLVIASGMTIGTIFTLFVVPVAYTYLAKARVAAAGAQHRLAPQAKAAE